MKSGKKMNQVKEILAQSGRDVLMVENCVVPAVHRLDSTLNESGNYILMKSGKKMNQVKEILAQSGRDVLMVENCGMENEHIYRSVEEIPDDAGYYSLIIAKEAKTLS